MSKGVAMEEKKRGCACAFPIVLGIIVISVVLYNLFTPKTHNSSTSKTGLSQVATKEFEGYYLRFGDEFKPGLTAIDDLGLSIVIAIDCSGSMKEYPKSGQNTEKYMIASQALTEIVDFLENSYNKTWKKDKIKIKIGLIKFSNDVDTLFELAEMNTEAFAKLRAVTSDPKSFYPNGSTAIGETLERGAEALAQSGTIFKSLIVISDGENTSGVEPDEVMTAIVENKNNKTTDDFPVSTSNILVSFIGFDMDAGDFTELHDLGARVMTAGNKEELNKSMTDIFLADINKLEAK